MIGLFSILRRTTSSLKFRWRSRISAVAQRTSPAAQDGAAWLVGPLEEHLSDHLCPDTLHTRWKREINIKDLGAVPSGAPRGSASSWPINTLDECHNRSLNHIKPSKMLRLRYVNRRRRKLSEDEIELKDVARAERENII